MEKITDEMLMAYVDGELDTQQAEMVERALEHDSELRERITLFQETGTVLQDLYKQPLQEDVPPQLLKTVQEYKAPSLAERLNDFFSRFQAIPGGRPALAAAFVVVLLVGVTVISRLGFFPEQASVKNLLISSEAFQQALEQTPAGKMVSIDQYAATLVPVTSFQDRSLRFCRALELTIGNTETTEVRAIACRNQGGIWSMVTWLTDGEKDAQPTSDGEYRLAGSEDDFDQVIEGMRCGPLFGLDQEKQLIGRHWDASPVATRGERRR